jgi:hypothetical protein
MLNYYIKTLRKIKSKKVSLRKIFNKKYYPLMVIFLKKALKC